MKEFKVGKNYRIHPLSYQPGGVIIIVSYINGKILKYTDVVYPQKYIDQVINNPNNKNKILKIKIRYNDGSEETIK